MSQHVRISEAGFKILQDPALAYKVSRAILANKRLLHFGGEVIVDGIRIRSVSGIKKTSNILNDEVSDTTGDAI